MVETQEQEQVTAVEVGDTVAVVDESYIEHHALVTAVHGAFGGTYIPCINVVYASADPLKTDPWGRQMERMSSLQHFSAGPDKMPKPGRYWRNI